MFGLLSNYLFIGNKLVNSFKVKYLINTYIMIVFSLSNP